MVLAADLHGHTFRSDAHASPEEFVELRRSRGLQLIAISDHDVMSSVKRGAAAARRAGLIFLPAVECTTHLGFGTPEAEQIHVLAYFPARFADDDRFEKTALFRRGQEVERRWKKIVLGWIENLAADDRMLFDRQLVDLPPEQFPAIQGMFDRVAELDRGDLLERFRQKLMSFWASERDLFGWDPAEAIEMIRGDGALDVIAHPGRYLRQDALFPVLEYAAGIEVYTARHRPEVARHFRQLADRMNKLWTAGTDDHQLEPYHPPATPMSEAWLEHLER